MIYLFFLLLLTSCTDEIEEYHVKKGTALQTHMPFLTKPKGPALKWKTPPVWEEKKAEGMRSASFIAKNDEGKEADISAVFLKGSSGGDLANVNRWREQAGLSSWSLDEFETNHKVKSTSLGEALVVDFTGNQRIVAAFVATAEGTWFFKMTGEHSVVQDNLPAFFDWLGSIEVAK